MILVNSVRINSLNRIKRHARMKQTVSFGRVLHARNDTNSGDGMFVNAVSDYVCWMLVLGLLSHKQLANKTNI